MSCLVTNPHRLLAFNPATPLLPLGSSPPRGHPSFAAPPSHNRRFFLWRRLIPLSLLTIDSSISGSASESTMMMGASLRCFEVELEVEGVGLEVKGTGFMLEGVN